MDNETPDAGTKPGKTETPGRSLPKSTPFQPAAAATAEAAPESAPSPQALVTVPKGQATSTAAIEPDERGGIFRQLVAEEGDITGLVAYSIYKQNKLDWLHAFDKAKHRQPTADELAAYIVGEGTPRRIATYRHLAEATLAGNGPDVGGTGAGAGGAFRRRGGALDRRSLTTGLMAAYGLIAVLLLVVVWMAMHYTMTSR